MKNAGMGPGLRKLGSEFTTKFISEAGTKPKNKDYFGFVEMDNFACWAIAETYDNDDEVISAKLAVDTVLDLFTKKPTLSKGKLKSYVKEAHRQLKDQSGKFQLKASILIVATNYKKMRYANCGNCRLYLFRGDNLILKSHDQSLYQNMIDEGEIPDDDERGIEESRNLFNYLGKHSSVKVEVSKKIVLYDEDILLLATWGFWEKIASLEILDAIDGVTDPIEFLDDLQDLFLSKQEKQISNYTMVSVFASKTFKEKSNKKKIIKIVLLVTVILLIIGIILFIYFRKARIKRTELINSVIEYELQGDIYIEDVNYERALAEYDSGIKESKSLKETRGKKGEENKIIKDSITTKQRVSQLIVDGDVLFAKGKYAEAKLSYEKALKEAKYDYDFYDIIDIKEINKKIELCDDYAYTEDLIGLADYQAGLEQNEQALESYEEARKIAARSKNKAAEQDIRLKMETLKSQIKAEAKAQEEEEREKAEQAKEDRIKAIEITALEGDMAATNGDYSKAIDTYAKARNSFMEAQEIDKAVEMEEKIAAVTAKIKEEEDGEQISIAEGYIQIGDGYMLENKFDSAITNYKLAKDIYSGIKYTDGITNVNELISDANAKKKEFEIAEKLIEIGLIEDSGDKLLKEQNYSGAKEQYRQAQILYQSLNQMDKVLLIQDKIKGVEEIESDIKGEAAEKGKEKLAYDAAVSEMYGDQEAEDKDYEAALGYYRKAQILYQNAEEYEKAAEVQQKIIEMEKKV